jgi:aspartate racemase
MIAFEMAHQLQRQGQEVALLVLLDPSSPRSGTAPRGSLMQRLKGMGKTLVRLVAEWYLKSGRRVPPVLRMPYFLDVSRRAACDYVPQVYPGRVILFRAARGVGSLADAWRRFAAGGVEVHEVPGDHTTIFREPHVQVLAQQLTAALSRAQGETIL